MNSRYCQAYELGVPNSDHLDKNVQVNDSIKFNIMSWSPYIYGQALPSNQNVTQICGPLLGLLFEVARLTKSNVTFIEYNNTQTEITLSGYAQFLNISIFSPALDIFPAVSMTSFKWTESFTLQALNTFNIWLVYLYFAFYLGLNFLVATLSWSNYRDEKVFKNLTRILLQQPLVPLSSSQKTFKFVLNFLILSTLFKFLVSDLFLTMLTFRSPDRAIQTIQDLYDHPKVKILVLQDEVPFNYLGEEPYKRHLANRLEVKNVDSIMNTTWEANIIKRIHARELVCLLDQPLLDFIHLKYVHHFPNLYRSPEHHIMTPFLVPLYHRKFTTQFMRMITTLTETGLFRHWVSETLWLNRHSMSQMIQLENHNLHLIDGPKVKYKPLGVHDLTFLAGLLFYLYLLAFAVFLCELFTFCVAYRLRYYINK